MKRTLSYCVLLTCGFLTPLQMSQASPAPENAIPSDVDWFIHLDADLLRTTQSGKAFIREFHNVLPKDKEGQNQMPIDPIQILDGIKGLTLFGSMPDMEERGPDSVDAVVLFEGTPELIKVFRGLVSGLQLDKPESIVTTEFGSNKILTLAEEGLHGCFVDDSHLALGKSLFMLEKFLTVEAGHGRHISFSERFPTYRLGSHSGIFFGAFVQGLGTFANLPVQARLLKLAQAVSIQLGEKDESVNLLASLVTDSPIKGQQVQEVLQGMLALLVITQNGQEDLAALINSAKVDLEGSSVTLRIAYPVERVEKWAVVLADMARNAIEESQQEVAPSENAAPADNQPASGE